jgi:hypothetical protein
MAGASIEEVLDDTRRFLVRERALLLPLSFATFGMATLIAGAMVPVPKSPTAGLPPGPWMIALVPMMLLVLVGYLAVSRMVLRSRISVAEALGDAVRLLPRAIGLFLTAFLIFVALNVVASLIAGLVGAAMGMDPKAMVMLALVMVFPPAIVISVRLALMLPVLADRESSVRQTLTEAIALTRGNALKIVGLLIAQVIFYLLIAAVIESAVGSLFILVARAAGNATLAPILVNVLMAAFNAVYWCFWAVLFASFYARLRGGTKGI